MFHYYQTYDGYFNHYYRIQTIEPKIGDRYEALHLNTSSICINSNDVVLSEKMVKVTEQEFDEELTKAIDSLGIRLKKFKFI